MTDQNETLQTYLAEIERGVPVETVLNALPAESADLAPLIRLAASTRGLAHPVMRPEIVQAQQAQVVNTARAMRALAAGVQRRGIGWQCPEIRWHSPAPSLWCWW